MAQFDTLIKGGVIFDGTQGARFVGDIGIKDGLIAQIDRKGKLDPAFALQTIDASGRYGCQGFVD